MLFTKLGQCTDNYIRLVLFPQSWGSHRSAAARASGQPRDGATGSGAVRGGGAAPAAYSQRSSVRCPREGVTQPLARLIPQSCSLSHRWNPPVPNCSRWTSVPNWSHRPQLDRCCSIPGSWQRRSCPVGWQASVPDR